MTLAVDIFGLYLLRTIKQKGSELNRASVPPLKGSPSAAFRSLLVSISFLSLPDIMAFNEGRSGPI